MESTAKFIDAIEKENYSNAQRYLAQAAQEVIDQRVELEKEKIRAKYSDEV